MLKIDGTPLEEAEAEQLTEISARLSALHEEIDAFLELVKRRRPTPPEPEDLVEPFAAVMGAATKIDVAWNRESATLRSIVKSLRKHRDGGVFSTRNLNHPTTIRLEYRRSAEALSAWVDYHALAIERCQERHGSDHPTATQR